MPLESEIFDQVYASIPEEQHPITMFMMISFGMC
jgi:hypothetical protein